MNRQIILASASPRRIEIMKNNGIEPIIMPSNADETLPLKITMEQAVMYLAFKKARYIENFLRLNTVNPSIPSVIIAADTIVYKNGIIGKPANKSDAQDTLKLLRNTNHYVATGVAFIDPGTSKRSVFYEVTEVIFKDYSDDEIKNYLDTDEPWDKAGSYAIQGTWGKHICRIIGSYDNVIGFPWEKIKTELENNYPEVLI